MTPERAQRLLSYHSCRNPDIDNRRWKHGFVGMLRPYGGLREQSFREVMECLRALVPTLSEPLVPRGLMDDLWGICTHPRTWGVDPDGMLRRNNLISPEEVEQLERWIDLISDTVSLLLDHDSDDLADISAHAFEPYERYLAEHP